MATHTGPHVPSWHYPHGHAGSIRVCNKCGLVQRKTRSGDWQ